MGILGIKIVGVETVRYMVTELAMRSFGLEIFAPLTVSLKDISTIINKKTPFDCQSICKL